jgi:hypothetical protein
MFDGVPTVTYKRKKYPVSDGSSIFLDKSIGQSSKPTAQFDVELGPANGDPDMAFSDQTDAVQKPSPLNFDEFEWDENQEEVIRASASDRLIVDAGPGTGKTAVACARVAHLIEELDCQANRIWLISFTRTAVKEIRDRISQLMTDPDSAFGVKIATLDSHAWALHSGFDGIATITGTHETNIEKLLEMVLNDPELIDYLQNRVEHLIVDEAQDIVGIRSDLVVELIKKLPSDTGVTVFADDAQGIYGFADDNEVRTSEGGHKLLTERLEAEDLTPSFERRGLLKIYRTSSPSLLKIFGDVRKGVMSDDETAETKYETVIRAVEELADRRGSQASSDVRGGDDRFVLFRTRSGVLQLSSFLNSKGSKHRIRMSGLPVCIFPWVGACLHDHGKSTLTKDDFLSVWKARVTGSPLEIMDANRAWDLMVRFAGKTEKVIEMNRLRGVLGRSQPPAEFCFPELGTSGPILGTIHAAKGREAEVVHLMLSTQKRDEMNFDEEARVVFVGATRPKSRLVVEKVGNDYASSLVGSKRVYRILPKRNGSTVRAQVEIGLSGDIDVEGLAGRSYFATSDDVFKTQQLLIENSNGGLKAEISVQPKSFLSRLVLEDTADVLAYTGDYLKKDLFAIGSIIASKRKAGKVRPPMRIKHLHMIGTRTLALGPDAALAGKLHETWQQSGFVLAPVITGFATLYYKNFGK